MLGISKWRVYLAQAGELRRLLTSSTSWQSDSSGKTNKAVVAGVGICGLLAAYYGFTNEKEAEPKSLVKNVIGRKFSLYAATKVKKVSR